MSDGFNKRKGKMNLAEYAIKEFSIPLSLGFVTVFKDNYRQVNDDFNLSSFQRTPPIIRFSSFFENNYRRYY